MLKRTLILLVASFLFIFQSSLIVFAETIRDDLVEETLMDKEVSRPVLNQEIIKDEVSSSDFTERQLTQPNQSSNFIKEDFPVEFIHSKDFVKPDGSYKLIDEFTDTIIVPISSIETIKNKKDLNEGDSLKFKVVENVEVKGKLFIKKDTPVEGILETITKSSHGGDPAEIIVGRFITTDINGNKVELAGEVQKRGLSLIGIKILMDSLGALWPICPPFSVPLALLPLTRFLYWGGNAKIKPKYTFNLYYE